jgi:hypothetical protein
MQTNNCTFEKIFPKQAILANPWRYSVLGNYSPIGWINAPSLSTFQCLIIASI